MCGRCHHADTMSNHSRLCGYFGFVYQKVVGESLLYDERLGRILDWL